ncbi:ABC transporter substrate-binding protein [Synergistales bacterium]|nr:ABC transporter substrate-binding protein [Synergistales bacterium]
MFSLGAGDALVGVTRFCDYPPDVFQKEIPRLTNMLDVSPEMLLTVAPDLVVLDNLNFNLKDRIENLGIDVFVLRSDNIPTLCDSIEGLGSVLNLRERGSEIASSIRSELERIRLLTNGLPRPRVAIAVDRDVKDPLIHSLYIAGRESFYDELINLSGGENAFNMAGVTYPRMSAEGLLALDPDVIIDIVGSHAGYELNSGAIQSAIQNQWKSLPELKAVRGARVYLVQGDEALRPGPRIIGVLRRFAIFIHPELASEIDTRPLNKTTCSK